MSSSTGAVTLPNDATLFPFKSIDRRFVGWFQDLSWKLENNFFYAIEKKRLDWIGCKSTRQLSRR